MDSVEFSRMLSISALQCNARYEWTFTLNACSNWDCITKIFYVNLGSFWLPCHRHGIFHSEVMENLNYFVVISEINNCKVSQLKYNLLCKSVTETTNHFFFQFNSINSIYLFSSLKNTKSNLQWQEWLLHNKYERCGCHQRAWDWWHPKVTRKINIYGKWS